MLQRPEPACLVIADISGYTVYLAGTELDHAQDILADLISTVVGALRPTFRLAKLEGDAAFTYSPVETVDGSLLQDTIERCYYAFRRRLRDIAQASTCECNACIRIPTLDLKFVAHHGQVVRQRIAGRDELAGADVIVAHRLLKNDVVEQLGVAAYALYTEPCLAAMGLADPGSAGLIEHRGTYESIGEVTSWVRDLEAAWQTELGRTRVFVEPDQAAMEIVNEYDGPPEIVWEWVTSPARRPKWQDGVVEVREDVAGGRRGVGTTNHCIHGKDAIVEEIVDWRPFDHFTFRFKMPMPGAPGLMMTDVFEATSTGTRVTTRVLRPKSAKDRTFLEMAEPVLVHAVQAGADALKPLVAADTADRLGSVNETQADLPVSAGRFASEPLEVGK